MQKTRQDEEDTGGERDDASVRRGKVDDKYSEAHQATLELTRTTHSLIHITVSVCIHDPHKGGKNIYNYDTLLSVLGRPPCWNIVPVDI